MPNIAGCVGSGVTTKRRAPRPRAICVSCDWAAWQVVPALEAHLYEKARAPAQRKKPPTAPVLWCASGNETPMTVAGASGFGETPQSTVTVYRPAAGVRNE